MVHVYFVTFVVYMLFFKFRSTQESNGGPKLNSSDGPHVTGQVEGQQEQQPGGDGTDEGFTIFA
jgi:hypothetical protein